MQEFKALREALFTVTAEEKAAKYIEFLEQNDDLEPSDVIEAAQEILRLQADGQDHENEKKALYFLSKAYSQLGDYQQCVQHLRQIFQKWDALLGKQERAEYKDKLGTAYWHLSDYHKALESLIEALEYYNRINDRSRVAALESNIGVIFGEIDQDKKSEEFTRRALSTATEIGDQAQRASYLNNLGIILFRKGNRRKSLECFLESAEIKERLGNTKKLITTYLNIADSYEELQERDKVVPYLEKATRLARENNDVRHQAKSLGQLGIHYMSGGDLSRAEECLEESLRLFLNTTYLKYTARILENLSLLCEKKGDYEKALNYQRKQAEVERKLFSEETARRIAEAQTLYEAKKKELEAELLRERTDELTRLNKEISAQYRDLEVAEVALKEANKILRRKMEIDPLTGLLNNQRIYEKIQSLIDHSTANDEPLSIVMFDLDHFKQLNDKYGHPVGNKALAKVARTIKENIRDHDLAFRFGGEEFLVLLTGRGRDVAVRVAERIRKAVEKMSFHESLRITVSGGAKQLANENAHELVVEADRLLYEAKRLGRNRTMY